jgi:hypothetical protein
MKLATFAALAILLGTGSAFAGAGAPVPEKPAGGAPSGRPGPVIDQCEAIWDMLTVEMVVRNPPPIAPWGRGC